MNPVIFTSVTPDELQTLISEAVKSEIRHIQPLPESEPEFITRKEAAKILGISLPTLHFWTRDGKIPAYRIGNRVRYKKAEVLNSLNKIRT